MRILKFIGAFLATLIIVLFIAFGFSFDALFTLFENREGLQEGQEWVAKTSSLQGLTEYIGAQPERVSIASLASGDTASSIYYNERTPRTMGRLSNLLLVLEYVRLTDAGKLDPSTRISLDEVNRYQLPYIDETSHENALSVLSDEGKISEDGTVALSDLVQAAVEFSDLAASDYLLFTLGRKNIERLMDDLALGDTESALPFSGLYITLNPPDNEQDFMQRLDSLSRLSRIEFEELVLQNSRRFLNDDTFRDEVLEVFEERQGLGVRFTEERDALDLFPKTTAFEMATLMQRIAQETLISKSVSKAVKEVLSWPLSDRQISAGLRNYGALYDSRIGMANGIDFGVASAGGAPVAQAIFFDDLQVAFWFHMSSNLIHHDFQQRLIWDPDLRQNTLEEIHKER